MELDPGSAESRLECGDELTAEHTAEHFDGKKKGVVGGDPASVVRSEAASGDYAVNMRMMLQSLIPAAFICMFKKVLGFTPALYFKAGA